MGGIIYRYLYSEDGSIVSSDGKTLFKVPDIPHYRIQEGIEVIDSKAFWNRPYPENCIRSEKLKAEIAQGWTDEFGGSLQQRPETSAGMR